MFFGGKGTPPLAREVFPFPPSPPSLPQRALSGRMDGAIAPQLSPWRSSPGKTNLYGFVFFLVGSARFLRQFRRLISSTGLCVSPLKKGESRGGGSLRTRGRTAFPSATFPSPYRPAGARPLFSRCGRLPAGAPPPFLVADAACRGREGDPGRPEGGRSAAAGADITPATGRGRFAPMPHAARGGRGTARLRRHISRSRIKGSTGVQGV